MNNYTLMTDFYELTMAQTYYNDNKQNEVVYFDVFYRNNPFKGGYLITAGLDNIIEYINNFKFNNDDIDYLRGLNMFNEEFLNYLKDLKFTGDIYAIPDGTVVFPNEPIITVKANIIEAQLIETALLTNFNHGSLVVTATKRIVNEAKDKPVMEFGARRARGLESAVEASKYAIIGGCCGTSNTYAGKKYGLKVMGTMAHSLVTSYDTEYEAFLGYAKSNPNNCTFLVDTYDTLKSGIPNAIKVCRKLNLPLKGIRIDSGDLEYLSKQARIMLDEAGYKDATICLSNGLNEYTISSFISNGATFDSIGAGDNIAASKERVGGVYKLVASQKDDKVIPRIKVSEESIKTTNPGYKKVYRFYDKETNYALGDIIALHDEEINKENYTLVHPVETWKTTNLKNYNVKELQIPIFKDGVQVYNLPTIQERKEYCDKEFETIYPEVKRVINPHEYYVDLSDKLRELKGSLIEEHRNSYTKKLGEHPCAK